jgi:hypothetical protein
VTIREVCGDMVNETTRTENVVDSTGSGVYWALHHATVDATSKAIGLHITNRNTLESIASSLGVAAKRAYP